MEHLDIVQYMLSSNSLIVCIQRMRKILSFLSICSHSLFQGSRRIADIKFTGLTIGPGTYILVYEVTFTWIIELIIFHEKIAELTTFVINEYFDR